MTINTAKIKKAILDFFTGGEERLVPRTVHHYAQFLMHKHDTSKITSLVLQEAGFFVVTLRSLNNERQRKVKRMMSKNEVRFTDYYMDEYYEYVAFSKEEDAAWFKLSIGAIDSTEE